MLLASTFLGIVRVLDRDKLTVFAINTIWSLACGIGVVCLTCGMVSRLPGIRARGFLAGMSFVVLAGPLAVWSCSPLETATSCGIGILRSVAVGS